MAYEYEWKVDVADTDFSGFIYSPAVLDYSIRAINQLMESIDHAAYQIRERTGSLYPTRRAEVEFIRPARAGDTVTIEVEPDVGDSSMTFDAVGTRDDTRVFEATVTMVFVDAESVEPRPVPEAVRSGLAPYAGE